MCAPICRYYSTQNYFPLTLTHNYFYISISLVRPRPLSPDSTSRVLSDAAIIASSSIGLFSIVRFDYRGSKKSIVFIRLRVICPGEHMRRFLNLFFFIECIQFCIAFKFSLMDDVIKSHECLK